MKKTTKTIYGYVRGSTNDVDLNNQLKTLNIEAKKRGIKIEVISEVISSGKALEKRELSNLIKTAKSGDHILCAELSRLARDTYEILTIQKKCIEKQITLEILNPPLVFDGSAMSEMLVTIMAAVATLEKTMIKSRVQIAIDHKQTQIKETGHFISKAGKKINKLGIPAGTKKTLLLEAKAHEILKFHNKGLNQSSIAKLIDTNRINVSRFLQRFKIVDGAYVNAPKSFKR